MNFNKQLIIISRVREEKKEDEGERGLCVITSIVFLDDTEQFLRVGERGTNKKPRSSFPAARCRCGPPK